MPALSNPGSAALGLLLNNVWHYPVVRKEEAYLEATAPAPAAIFLFLTATIVAGCAVDSGSPGQPDLILISVDTLRRDNLGCYGYPRGTSPNLDSLAARGVVFENALSTASWTLPAHVSMLTGLYPASHAVQDDGSKLAESLPAVAERLTDAGYNALAVVSHVYVSRAFGLARGFDIFDESLTEGGSKNPRAGPVVDRTLEHVDRLPRDQPLFVFVHFFDPHWEYSPPPPFDRQFIDPAYAGPIDGTLASLSPYFELGSPMAAPDLRQAVDLYDGEIAYVDVEIGRLIRELERRRRPTVVALTSDHGEEFKEHGSLGHGRTLFEEQLRVPLILVGDSERLVAGMRRQEPVSLVDIAPTLVELAGAEPLVGAQGVSLLAPGVRSRVVFGESIRFGNEIRYARLGPFKMIHWEQGDRRVFFDLERDPWERQPMREDPSGGRLESALAEHAARADRGWHLKLIGLGDTRLRFRGTIRTAARLLRPRRYYSGLLGGPAGVEFPVFDVEPLPDDAGSVLSFEAIVSGRIAQVSFETDPGDATVSFQVEVEGDDASAGLFLGRGHRMQPREELELSPDDPRLEGTPPSYGQAAPGCYIRAVRGVTPPPVDLSEEAIERLRALGYLGSGGG